MIRFDIQARCGQVRLFEGCWLNSLTCQVDTYCYSGIRRKTVLNMPLLPNLDLKNDPVLTHTLQNYCVLLHVLPQIPIHIYIRMYMYISGQEALKPNWKLCQISSVTTDTKGNLALTCLTHTLAADVCMCVCLCVSVCDVLLCVTF